MSPFVIFVSLVTCACGELPFDTSAQGSQLEVPSERPLGMCISIEEHDEMEEHTAKWREQRWNLSVFSTLLAVICIGWQRVSKLFRNIYEENIEKLGAAEPLSSIDYVRVDVDDVSGAVTLSSRPQRSISRLLSFAVLWACVTLAVGGFGPAYIVRASGKPWFFDAIRQIGPNSFELSTTVHAATGALWVSVISHQLVTAWFGVPPRESEAKTFGWSHRVVGYLASMIIGVCALTGIYVTYGSSVSRVADTHMVVVDGVFIAVNFAVGIVAVVQGNINAHKQGMSFAIIWTAWPGGLRLFGYIHALYVGDTNVAAPDCMRLLRNNTPAYCQWITFAQTGAGIGDIAGYYAWVICIVFAVIVTAIGIYSHSIISIDWGIVIGNLVGLLTASLGSVLMIDYPYNIISPAIIWACFGCGDPPGCEASCESDRSLCTT